MSAPFKGYPASVSGPDTCAINSGERHALELTKGAGLVRQLAIWRDADQRRIALELEWRNLEASLFETARRMNIACDVAIESDLPEAVAMRRVDEELAALTSEMTEIAMSATTAPALSLEDALAQISLGLMVQGPFDWRDHALELVEGGLARTRDFLARDR